MSDQDTEKSEEATERKLEQARKEGQVASSKELQSAMVLLVGGFCVLTAVPWVGESVVNLFRDMLARAATGEFTSRDIPRMVSEVLMAVGPAVLLVLVPTTLTALATGMAGTGGNVTTEVLDLKWDRLDPTTNFSQQFLSRQPWVQLAKGLAITVVIAWAAYSAVLRHLDALPLTATWPVGGQAGFLRAVTVDVMKRAVPAALAVGALDYLYQRWDLSQKLMMSRQEVKQENKDQDGDPLIRAKRRQRARQLAFGNQLREVPRADVVVTNPTHYAVALRYRKEENAAPVVLARGVDALALRIRAEAAKHDIPTIENRPLARALYAASKSGRPIPPDFFGPVAQVLAVVYRRRKPSAGAGPKPTVKPGRQGLRAR
jgi:flagellar biosynthetic protein FlhB